MSLLPIWRRREEHSPLAGLQSEMNRLFSSFFERPAPWGGDAGFLPAVDVQEMDDKLVVEAELPGLAPNDVQVRLEGDSLVISGERKREKEEDEKGYHRVERYYGSFAREVPLPAGVDPERCEATYKDGVLRIEVAKREDAKPRTIPVKAK
jgi:HSP20 family protein